MKFLLSLQSSLNTVLLGYNAFGSFVGWGLGPVKNMLLQSPGVSMETFAHLLKLENLGREKSLKNITIIKNYLQTDPAEPVNGSFLWKSMRMLPYILLVANFADQLGCMLHQLAARRLIKDRG